MFRKILNILKKFIMAVLLIYAYNTMTLPMNIFIPMNIFTILLIMCFGIPSIFMLIFFSLLCV